jgi:hypothetical protein
MFRIVPAAFVAAIIVVSLGAQPTQEKKKLPDLEKLNPTNWGVIRQVGCNFVLEGHPHWEAVGVIREDGSINLLWTRLSDTFPCPGEYEVLQDGTLGGVWGENGEGEVKNGKTVGLTRPDRIYQLPPPEPEFK